MTAVSAALVGLVGQIHTGWHGQRWARKPRLGVSLLPAAVTLLGSPAALLTWRLCSLLNPPDRHSTDTVLSTAGGCRPGACISSCCSRGLGALSGYHQPAVHTACCGTAQLCVRGHAGNGGRCGGHACGAGALQLTLLLHTLLTCMAVILEARATHPAASQRCILQATLAICHHNWLYVTIIGYMSP